MARVRVQYTGDDKQDQANVVLARRINRAQAAFYNTYTLATGVNTVTHTAPFKPSGRIVVTQNGVSLLSDDVFSRTQWTVSASAPITVTVKWENA